MFNFVFFIFSLMMNEIRLVYFYKSLFWDPDTQSRVKITTIILTLTLINKNITHWTSSRTDNTKLFCWCYHVKRIHTHTHSQNKERLFIHMPVRAVILVEWTHTYVHTHTRYRHKIINYHDCQCNSTHKMFISTHVYRLQFSSNRSFIQNDDERVIIILLFSYITYNTHKKIIKLKYRRMFQWT